jgi:hypothetical protein
VLATEGVRAANQLRENERRLQFLDELGKETSKSTNSDAIFAIMALAGRDVCIPAAFVDRMNEIHCNGF